MRRFLLLPVTFFLLGALHSSETVGQVIFETEILLYENEAWYGGAVGIGERMPFAASFGEFDLSRQNANNQNVPLLISSSGRYIWSDRPFSFERRDRSLVVRSHHEIIEPVTAGRTLREAYMAAMRKHFPPSGKRPPEEFFTAPQYNTWIELAYDQNQRDILRYAEGIVASGLPAGVLMIDDNWMRYYGNFDFRAEKFDDPRGMVERLNEMGFRVMLWVCPFVSPDSPEYRYLAARGFLLRRPNFDAPGVIEWWNGQSACYDMTNPAAREHFIVQLRRLQTDYGIDGFKLDAGDPGFYNPARVRGFDPDALSVDHTQAWAEIGLEFPFNEYRACWKMGNQPLVQRLGDKHHAWWAVESLIPQMTAAGLLGYAFTCPDMIGGGQYDSFHGARAVNIDQRQFVRSAQVHALMPMMQFSAAPWRLLDDEHQAAILAAVGLRERFLSYIMELARAAADGGEPIVRHMEYAFPHEGFAECRDQFMLGDRFLVAPVVTPGDSRTVRLPRGRWRDDMGRTHRGGTTITIDAPLARIPYFERIN
ncbi:MAG: glycoside hydrolase family 31 protein [Rikenellaceae bacterium]|nr:glycoside hydrolase family 31 protein [Rikenellaceae bacterium]MCL2693334.1 glycoside hydrolase family 31 protein [Rikenellaceae bacterium]